jgi:hypothetical protein
MYEMFTLGATSNHEIIDKSIVASINTNYTPGIQFGIGKEFDASWHYAFPGKSGSSLFWFFY